MTNTEEKVERILDVSNLPCPIPAMRTRLEIKKISPGGLLKVIATSDKTHTTIPRFCEKNQHKLLLNFDENKKHIFIIQRNPEEI